LPRIDRRGGPFAFIQHDALAAQRGLERLDLPLLGGSVVDQPVQRLDERIVAATADAVGGKAHLIGRLLTLRIGLVVQDARRVADGRALRRHFLDHHRVRSDARAVAHGEAAQHLGPGTDDHPTAQRRMALGALGERGAPQRHALVNGAVVADLGGLADHDAHAMVHEDAAADDRPGMDLDAGQKARQVRDKAAGPAQPVRPAPVRDAVHPQRVQAGIAGDDFPGGARGRVAVADRLDVLAQAAQHALLRQQR